jgi:hypothetical protein
MIVEGMRSEKFLNFLKKKRGRSPFPGSVNACFDTQKNAQKKPLPKTRSLFTIAGEPRQTT